MSRSNSEGGKSRNESEYTWSALGSMRINREAAKAAGRVRERLRSDVIKSGCSGFYANVLTLVSWGRGMIFFNAEICDPRVSRAVTMPWALAVTSLALRITTQAGDETDPDVLVKS